MHKLAFVLVFSWSAVFAESPQLAVVSQHVSGGQLIVQVRNDAEVPATAILVGTSDAVFASADFLLAGREGRALQAGQIAEVKFASSGGGEARVLAGIFEDGSYQGDARLMNQLVAGRREVYSQLPMALALLRNGNVQNVSASTVAFWFHQWQDRWLAADPGRTMAIAMTAEVYLKRAGDAPATASAHDLIQVFEDLCAKLAASKPALN
jgi:hypothetical protein